MATAKSPDPKVILDGFFFVEGLLADALAYIPYCNEHLNVWSPRFTTIILEAASQTESIWREVLLSRPGANPGARTNIDNYFREFGSLLAKQWVVLFVPSTPVVIRPFGRWVDANFVGGKYRDTSLEWWDTYNALKHDRLTGLGRANLCAAVEAVASLLLAVAYSGACDIALLDAEMFESHISGFFNEHPQGDRFFKDANPRWWAKIESKLFAHPFGWCDKEIKPPNYWLGTKSFRFQYWWRTYSQSGNQFDWSAG